MKIDSKLDSVLSYYSDNELGFAHFSIILNKEYGLWFRFNINSTILGYPITSYTTDIFLIKSPFKDTQGNNPILTIDGISSDWVTNLSQVSRIIKLLSFS